MRSSALTGATDIRKSFNGLYDLGATVSAAIRRAATVGKARSRFMGSKFILTVLSL